MKFRFTSIGGLSIAMLLSLPMLASSQEAETAPDDTWISVSGVVESVSADRFDLDYGEGNLTVEFDDGDRDADAYVLDEGDRVTATGKVDDDLYESRTLEASSVYIESIGTYFYASAVDEEDQLDMVTISTPIDPSAIIVQGVVTDVDDEEFTVNTGLRRTIVEVEEMFYNPLDDIGYQQIDVGDRVSVSGDVDYDLFEGREIVADSIVTLSD